jgi:hypothetical protein
MNSFPLKVHNLSTTGVKKDLEDRLYEYYAQAPDADETPSLSPIELQLANTHFGDRESLKRKPGTAEGVHNGDKASSKKRKADAGR